MNQEKKVGVYMDFLESNPNLRFQKKNEYHRGPVILMSKKLDSYKLDVTLINITKIT